MQGTFHRLRVQAFCYATENEELIAETMADLLGEDGFEAEETEGEQGNRIVIFQAELTKQKEFDALFANLLPVVPELIADIENHVDDDCTFHTRLDKQKLVQGEVAVAHHGDVVSVTGKLVSHPARKEIAVEGLRAFLEAVRALPQPGTSE